MLLSKRKQSNVSYALDLILQILLDLPHHLIHNNKLIITGKNPKEIQEGEGKEVIADLVQENNVELTKTQNFLQEALSRGELDIVERILKLLVSL